MSSIALFIALTSAQDASQATSPWGQDEFHSSKPITWGPHKEHIVYRNVQHFGAAGDGSDATEAFRRAIFSDGSPTTSGDPPIVSGVAADVQSPVCAIGCNSSTIQPVLIYVPPGTYSFSSPIRLPYMTNLIGDAVTKPVLKAASNFVGASYLIDTNVYGDGGTNWFINQNNFYRQIRNLEIDLRDAPSSIPDFAAIHWQVAQATTLQNIDFLMTEGASSSQIGIYSENGSGGFMTDLTFTGGAVGAKLGSQQYTSRNLKFSGCRTAIEMIWTWGWVFHELNIQDSQVGLNMTPNATVSTIGTVIVLDSQIDAAVAGIVNPWIPDLAGKTDDPAWNSSLGNLVLDNVAFAKMGVVGLPGTQQTLPPAGSTVTRFVQGAQFQGASVAPGASGNVRNGNMQRILDGHSNDPLRPHNGKVFANSKPSYNDKQFCVLAREDPEGFQTYSDGKTSASQWLQGWIDRSIQQGKVLYVNYGVYLLSEPIRIGDGAMIMGELWPNFMIDGQAFSDASNPQAVVQIGEHGQTGDVQISDIVVTTFGPAVGAIAIQWNFKSHNVASPTSGLWDVHARIGGAYGTKLTAKECLKQPVSLNTAGQMQGMNYLGPDIPNPCGGVHTMFHATPGSGGLYLENNWFWVADHDFEDATNTQIDIFSARGVLIESQAGPVWMWGIASEHSVLYNYQFRDAKDIFMGFSQAESPYFQPLITALAPVTTDARLDDPESTMCAGNGVSTPCIETWGLRLLRCENVQIYGLGHYSFFKNYLQQPCISGVDCQRNMISVDAQSKGLTFYGVSSIAAVNILTFDGQSIGPAAHFQSMFVQALAMWSSPS